MSFQPIPAPGVGRPASPRPSNIRVAISKGVTHILIPRAINEKLDVVGDVIEVPLAVSVGSAEHQGLVQIDTKPAGEPNRTIRTIDGRLTVRLTQRALPIAHGNGTASPVPVSWAIKGHVLTVELPDDRYTVAASAKDYLRQQA